MVERSLWAFAGARSELCHRPAPVSRVFVSFGSCECRKKIPGPVSSWCHCRVDPGQVLSIARPRWRILRGLISIERADQLNNDQNAALILV